MSQDEVNRIEWENPENWSDPAVGVYFSKRDSRVWVPKRVPAFGWTLNLGRPQAAWWLVGTGDTGCCIEARAGCRLDPGPGSTFCLFDATSLRRCLI